jgi:putative phosphoesterase
MRVAIVSDVHGNRAAFEAVLADLRKTSPDLVLHGGDLADSGSGAVDIVDRIRDLGWEGVAGNTDETLFRPDSLQEFATQAPHLRTLFDAVEEMAAWTRERLGEDRLAWLKGLPVTQIRPGFAMVHATPASLWRAPMPEAGDAEIEAAYGSLGSAVVCYGHIHRPYVRSVRQRIVANSGSAGQPHDGDPRACYLLIDDSVPRVRRVEYDVEAELRALRACGIPHAAWVAKILSTARPQMP